MTDAAELQGHVDGHAERVAEGLPAVPEGPSLRCAFCPALFETPEQVKDHHASAHHK
ncbi:MAG: hypothetical protein L3K19_03450 [Thermoplasmata archaeon]|nr:hypothetical protein [Thermoplasmata archaeon]